MEIKKSHKADLEHRRPYILAAAFIASALIFVGVMFIPFKSLDQLAADFLDDYSMDLDIKANEQDDMISAAQPQQQVEQQESTKINKVDDMTEIAPEQLDQAQTQPEEDNPETEKTIEEPPINQNDDDAETQQIVDDLPMYPGGMVEFMKWLTKTLQYPEDALKKKVQGKVMISFIVEKDGTVSNIKLQKSSNSLLNAEALRVAHLMPKWEPGKEKGKPCRSMITIPIVFEI